VSVDVVSEEFLRRRRGRNIAIGLLLAGLCALFFIITVVRMMGQ
jgi:hypothetical protein